MKNEIAKISIRARVAYTLECLENALNKESQALDEWRFLLINLWQYTETENLGNWHYKISEMTPFSIMEDIPYSKKDCEYITEEEHNVLKEIYKKVSEFILNIIDLIFEIGTLDLYSSIVNSSPRTVTFVLKVIDILESQNIPQPSIDNYLKYSIMMKNGWGIPFNRSDLNLTSTT